MTYRTLTLAFILLFAVPEAAYGQTKTYEASGTAVMGTGMTIDETKRLALDDARREALQQFGTYLRSTQTVSDGQLSEEIEVISASVVRVRDKNFRRTEVEETFRYSAEAVFEIDVDRFNEKVQKYRSDPKVTGAARIERKIDSTTGAERKAYRLRALSLLAKLNRSEAKINASRAKLSFDRRSKSGFSSHLSYVLKRGYPYTFLEVVKEKAPSITGLERDVPTVEGKYVLRHKSLEKSRGIGDTLSALSKNWSGRALEDSLKMGFNVSFIGTNAAGTVEFVKPVFGFGTDYTGGFPVGRDIRKWRTVDKAEEYAREIGEFDFAITTSKLYDVESVNVVITKFPNSFWLAKYLKRNGFSRNSDVWVNTGGSLTSASDLVLTKEAFEKRLKGF